MPQHPTFDNLVDSCDVYNRHVGIEVSKALAGRKEQRRTMTALVIGSGDREFLRQAIQNEDLEQAAKAIQRQLAK